MAHYPKVWDIVQGMTPETAEGSFIRDVMPYLVNVWLEEYESSTSDPEIVETTLGNFSYLFDIRLGRLIAAWGISRGKHTGARDKSRMARHPLSAGRHYHRGHAIPHTLGGPTDINLVAQRGSVNIGAFRRLENRAVATPGALYFTHWIYDRTEGQKPRSVEQGVLIPGRPPEILTHGN